MDRVSGYSLTFLLPCLNEERTVGECVSIARQALKELGCSGEVLVADNGSCDASVQRAAAAGARVVHVPERGYGVALRGGIQAAQGEYIIMGDADLSYDFSAASVQPFIAALHQGADLVMGNRFRGGIRPGAMPWLHRYLGTPFMTWAINRLFGIGIGDVNCGLRGFRRDSILRLGLKSSGMEFASEMLIRAKQQGLVIREVPATLSPDGRDRKPHLRSIRDGLRHLRVWARLWLSQHRDPV